MEAQMSALIPRTREFSFFDAPVRSLQREVDSLFRNFFDDSGSAAFGSWPAVDFSETPESYVLRAELPGMDAKDVDIRLEGDVLSLSGERKEEVKKEGTNLHFTERRYGRWQRSFRVPATADAGRTEAKMVNGVLEVTIGKRPEARPQVIKVKAQ